MKEVIILGGANGTGKSTLANFLIAQTNYTFLNADEIEKQLPDLQKGTPITHLKAGRILFDKLRNEQANGHSFILETTLSGKTLRSILNDLKTDGYRITIVYVFLETPELCIERIKNRVKRGGHFVSDEDVRRRYYRSIQNFWHRYRLLADVWTVYLNMELAPIPIATGFTSEMHIADSIIFQSFINLTIQK